MQIENYRTIIDIHDLNAHLLQEKAIVLYFSL